MRVNQTIAEMLNYAIQNPCSDDSDIKQYQRRWNDRADLTLTLFLKDELGYVSLTANRDSAVDEKITDIIVSLASLSCLRTMGKSTEKHIIHRFEFNNPIYKRPIFSSELDKYLPQTINRIESIEGKRENYQTTKSYRKLVSPPVSSYDLSLPEEEPDEPYWHKLSNDQCHICHRELTDPISVRVSIGPVCRKRIQEREEHDSKMWNDIAKQELERIWTEYNVYERRRLAKKRG